ncbi:hypothetical protein [Priestia megaterium]|nr:hypothetical protein [Priestia megaterium]
MKTTTVDQEWLEIMQLAESYGFSPNQVREMIKDFKEELDHAIFSKPE